MRDVHQSISSEKGLAKKTSVIFNLKPWTGSKIMSYNEDGFDQLKRSRSNFEATPTLTSNQQSSPMLLSIPPPIPLIDSKRALAAVLENLSKISTEIPAFVPVTDSIYKNRLEKALLKNFDYIRRFLSRLLPRIYPLYFSADTF
jgi:hypothetical protein